MSTSDEIKARLDIVDVISEYVPLKKAGRNYKGLCPFHSEKTPSFFVFPETQTWHCFGACHTGGDLFTFVMKQENMDFGEALRFLAPKAGVQLRAPSPRDTEQQKKLDKLLAIHAAAASYYHQQLLHSERAQGVRAYAARRGLNDETIARFQLGYAPDEWRALSRHLIERGYERQDLLDAGLIIVRDDGGYYDRFRGRLIVPIRDTRGRVIAFGGRILDKGEPKYLNSPQTPLFNKSRVLFGLDLAKGAIRARGYVVIVEGYMDVLQAHQAGFGNVVATMGIALTEHQLNLLKRMTKRYFLALDPDLAGDQGTLRGLTVARQTLDRQTVPVPTANGWIRYESRLDADIRIMTLPDGQDPDDLIRDTPDQWEPLVETAIPVVDYYFQIVTRDLDLSSAKGKSEAVRRLAGVLSEIRDEVERTHYIQKLARLVRTDEATIRRQLRRPDASSRRGRGRSRRGEQESMPSQPEGVLPMHATEEHCLVVLFHHPDYLGRVNAVLDSLQMDALGPEDLQGAENRSLFVAWQQAQAGQEWEQWVDTLSPALQSHLEALLQRNAGAEDMVGDDAVRDIERTALLLRLKNLERLSLNLSVLQASALEEGNARAPEYDQTLRSLPQTLFRLQRALAERTLLGKREEKNRVP